MKYAINRSAIYSGGFAKINSYDIHGYPFVWSNVRRTFGIIFKLPHIGALVTLHGFVHQIGLPRRDSSNYEKNRYGGFFYAISLLVESVFFLAIGGRRIIAGTIIALIFVGHLGS